MILISHRGNINRIESSEENKPEYIQAALDAGYDVEIDVWNLAGKWFLGHDYPVYPIDMDFLINEKLLCHAKNLPALDLMLKIDTHCFWHQEDHYTLTNKGYILSYPGYSTPGQNTICMKAEYHSLSSIKDCYAICSDYVEYYKDSGNEEGKESFEQNYYGKYASFDSTR